MKTNPLVSVCIPIFNGELYIRETMDCILNQTYKNIEIIISDNCSTDMGIEIIKSYNDPRIKIYRNENNMGIKYNFQKVFTYATGKYLTFMGADDGMTLNAIDTLVNILEKKENKDVSVANGFISIINNESKHIYLKKFLFGSGKFSSYWAIRANFLYGSNIIGEPNGTLFRRDQYDNIPEPKFNNGNNWTFDLDMLLELLLQGKLYVVPEIIGKFRISPISTSNKELRFDHAKMFRQYAMTIYRDKRYNIGFHWVIAASINSWILMIARNFFYILFIKKKK